jgi:hypothetical protein
MNRRLAVLAAAAVLAAPAAAIAHHGWTSYDEAKPITFETKVLASHWGSPHGHVEGMHAGKRWTVVLAPTTRMTARGLTPEDVAVGKTVRLTAYAKRDGAPEMRAERIMVGDRTVELR